MSVPECYMTRMGRPKAFDQNKALDGAMEVFREHGFEGASAGMLSRAMGIGRQSWYDTFGDKWALYLAAVRRYAASEAAQHLAALQAGERAIDGISAMVRRVVRDASLPCLGVQSVCEFGRSRPELNAIHEAAGRKLREALTARIRDAQAEGDIAATLNADEAADFLLAGFGGIRIAARGGATAASLACLGDLTLRALT